MRGPKCWIVDAPRPRILLGAVVSCDDTLRATSAAKGEGGRDRQ
jgi:hypothetical protein